MNLFSENEKKERKEVLNEPGFSPYIGCSGVVVALRADSKFMTYVRASNRLISWMS